MSPTELLNEMERRAKNSPLFQRWLHFVKYEELTDDQLIFMTMELAIALDDVTKQLQAELLNSMRKHAEVLADELFPPDRLYRIPAKPTGVAESTAYVHEWNQAIVAAGAEEIDLPVSGSIHKWDKQWPDNPQANPNPDLAFKHPNNLPPFPTEEDELEPYSAEDERVMRQDSAYFQEREEQRDEQRCRTIQNYGEQHPQFHSPEMKAWRKRQ